MKFIFSSSLILFLFTTAFCQSHEDHREDTHVYAHKHEDTCPMFAYTLSYVVMKSDHSESDGLMYNFHYSFPSEKQLFNFNFGYALGVHYMNNDGPHTGIMAGLLLDIAENTQLGIMPTYSYYKHNHSPMHSGGMMMMASQDEWNSELGVHCELMFQAKLFNQAVNPVITYGHSKDHTHYSIGLHFHL